MYVGREGEETVGEQERHEAVSVSTSVSKNLDAHMAQGSFGTHSSTCSSFVSE